MARDQPLDGLPVVSPGHAQSSAITVEEVSRPGVRFGSHHPVIQARQDPAPPSVRTGHASRLDA